MVIGVGTAGTDMIITVVIEGTMVVITGMDITITMVAGTVVHMI